MSEPADGMRGGIGEQPGLTRLTTILETLIHGQTQQQIRDTHLQEQLSLLTRHVIALSTWQRRLLRVVLGLGVLLLVLCGGVGWQVLHPQS